MSRLMASLIAIASLSVAQAADMTFDLDDIVVLAENGLSDETILIFVQTREIGFTPDTDDIDKLLLAGVSEGVIRYLLQQTAIAAPIYTSYSSDSATYADQYPTNYYTPYYSGFPFVNGSSVYYRYGTASHHHHSGVHKRSGERHDVLQHRIGSPQFSHDGHRASGDSHSDKHSVIHISGHAPQYRASALEHSSPRAGHSFAGVLHTGNGSIGHNSHDGHNTGGHGLSSSFGHQGRHSRGHGSGHRSGHGSGHGGAGHGGGHGGGH